MMRPATIAMKSGRLLARSRRDALSKVGKKAISQKISLPKVQNITAETPQVVPPISRQTTPRSEGEKCVLEYPNGCAQSGCG